MDDTALLQYLLGKYPFTDLVHMLRSTAGCGMSLRISCLEPWLIEPELDPVLEATAASGCAGPTSAVVDANPSPVSFSDASSLNGSLYSACSEASTHKAPTKIAPKPATVRHSRARSASRKALSKLANSRTLAKHPCPLPARRKATFECPFCAERCITVEISRKNDLKRHFTEFHSGNSIWPCAVRGCQMIFDWKSAYVVHLKTAHSGEGPLPQEVMADTCPQVVFACGFNDCKRVFEAVSDLDAGQKAHDYFAHVADHFEDGLTHKNWSYSTRFRNLMRQELVEDAWKRRKKTAQQSPSWQPLSSFTLRKMLECRHIPDIPSFVQWAIVLSSMPYCNPRTPQPKLPPQFMISLKELCPFAQYDHRPDRPLMSFMSSPQDGLIAEPPTPVTPHAPAVPQPVLENQHPATHFSPREDGLPAMDPWMGTIPATIPDLMPINPVGTPRTITEVAHPVYADDNAMMLEGQSFDLWPDITFDPTFDHHFGLSNIPVQDSGPSCKAEEAPRASLPPSPLPGGHSLSTTSTGSHKEPKLSDISMRRFASFNVH